VCSLRNKWLNEDPSAFDAHDPNRGTGGDELAGGQDVDSPSVNRSDAGRAKKARRRSRSPA
jgi:hypothetical protein